MNVIRKERWLIASFSKPQIALSWAIYGGGRIKTKTVAWHQVKQQELKPPVDAKQFLGSRLMENAMPDAVGMLTSADLDAYADVQKTDEGLSVRSVATVGMDNALRVGDPVRLKSLPQTHQEMSRDPVRIGTINLLCAVSIPISEEAHLEALSIAVEARTTAVLEAKIPSTETGRPATGTGTDCVVIIAPCAVKSSAVEQMNRLEGYAGKHTLLGRLIGESVFEAVSIGLERWK